MRRSPVPAPARSSGGQLQRVGHHRRGRLLVGHQQVAGQQPDPVDPGGVAGVDQPAVQQAAGRPGAVEGRPTPSAETGTCSTGRQASAIPRTGAPPMIGDSPTTGAPAARSAGRIPGTFRMVLIDTTGLDGAIRISSASPMAC